MENYVKNNLETITIKINELNELYKDSSEFKNKVKEHINKEQQEYVNLFLNVFNNETSNIRMSYKIYNLIIYLIKTFQLSEEKIFLNLSKNEIFIFDEYLNSYKSCYISLKNEYGRYFKEAFLLEIDGKSSGNKIPPVWEGIFKNERYFNAFYNYKNKYILDINIDYSYLFQRMLIENFIYPIKHKDFIKWLSKFELIKDYEYHKLNEKGGFMSLLKSTSIQRTNNFNIVFEI